jgi:pyridoxal phosphate enzyme (YggS family)
MAEAPDTTAEVAGLRAVRRRILDRITAAAHRSGRDPAAVALVAVSKTVAEVRVRAAVAAGFTVLGENRVQEAASKIPAVSGAAWHLLGPLQSNKAKRAVELFDVIETVDSVAIASRLDRLAGDLRPGRRLEVLLQVNVDRDPNKAGIELADVIGVATAVCALPNLDVRGLMTIGRPGATPDDSRATFQALRELSERLRRSVAIGADLSMGMSDDFEVAIEEGATVVRVGRAIFGDRPVA